MNRREFFKTSAGYAAIILAPGIWSCRREVRSKQKIQFRQFQPNDSLVPILQITPEDGHYLHTYYDVTPFSQSQRYVVVTRLPFDDRLPVFGDMADICVIDLEEQTIETVYQTKSWGFQTASNVNWGATSDRYLYANDVIDGTTVCVRIDRESDEVKAFAGPMYHVAPDESCVISFPQELWAATQLGLGTPPKDYDKLPTLPPGASSNEGIWRTDLQTNTKTLIVTLADAAAVVPEPPPCDEYTYYFWHSKFNGQGTRVLQVLRCLCSGWQRESKGRNPMTISFDADGSDIHFCLPDFRPVYGNSGGHPHWEPDGEHITRVLKIDGKSVFTEFKYDGSGFKVLSEKISGGGHPSMHPNRRHMITDSKDETNGETTVTLRLIDFGLDEEEIVCTLPSVTYDHTPPNNVFRLDGHPAWDRDYKRVALQAVSNGYRQIFVMDVSGLTS